MYKIVVFS